MHRLLMCPHTRFASHISQSFSDSPARFRKKINLAKFKKKDGELLPTSEWHLKQLKNFCDLEFKSGLGFTEDNLQDIEPLPQGRVFAECPARADDIAKGMWKLDTKGVRVRSLERVKQNVNFCFEQLQGVLLSRQVAPAEGLGGNSDLALLLFRLCGFGSGEFRIGGRSIDLSFAGEKIHSATDVHVAMRRRATGQIVLIWEDKMSGADNTTNILECSAAQIVAQMIAVHCQNAEEKFAACEVYAVRLIDDRVAFFRMEMTAEEVEAVCKKGVIPDPKLLV